MSARSSNEELRSLLWLRALFFVALLLIATVAAAQSQIWLRSPGPPELYVHIEHGPPQAGRIEPGWWSAIWIVEPVAGVGAVRLRNRWKPGLFLHIEHGEVAAGPIQEGWWSAMWFIDPQPGGGQHLRNRWKPDHLLHINGGILRAGPPAPGATAAWTFDTQAPAAAQGAHKPVAEPVVATASATQTNDRKALCNQRYEGCKQRCEQRYPFGQVAAFSDCLDNCEVAIQACFAGNDRAFSIPGSEMASPSAAQTLPRLPQVWSSPIPPPRPTPGLNVPPPPVGPLPGGTAPRTPGEPVCHLWTHEPLRCLSRCVSGEPGAVGREVRMANCQAGSPGAGSPPVPGAPVVQPGGGYRHRSDRVANQCISMRGAYFVNRCGYLIAIRYCANWPGNAMSCGGPDFTKGSTSVPPNSERLSAIAAGQIDGRAAGSVLFMACRADPGQVTPVLRSPNDGSCMATD